MIRHIRSRKAAIAIFVAIIALLLVIRSYIPEEYVHDVVLSYGPLAPVVFVLLTLLVYIFFPLFAPPIVYAGYYAFGPDVVWYVSIASFLCFITNFWIARVWGRDLVITFVGKDAMKRIDQIGERYGLSTLFFLRVFQGGIHDLISYMGGLTTIPFWPYFIVSIIGLIPGMLLWYVISLRSHDSIEFFAISTAVSIVTAVAFIAFTYVKEKLVHKIQRKK